MLIYAADVIHFMWHRVINVGQLMKRFETKRCPILRNSGPVTDTNIKLHSLSRKLKSHGPSSDDTLESVRQL